MSHHRRNSTFSRELKRLERKRIRQADRQAINGGNVRVPHKERWAGRTAPTPIIDDGAPLRRKSPAGKDKAAARPRCSGNPHKRSHEYMYDDQVPSDEIWRATHKQERICAWCNHTQTRYLILSWSGRSSSWTNWSYKRYLAYSRPWWIS